MPISSDEYDIERDRLSKVVDIVRKHISSLGSELIQDEKKQAEFKKFLWDSHTEMDPGELASMMSNNDVEISILMSRGAYLQKLYKIQNKPYFGRIVFDSDEGERQDIYIGITHVEDNLEYYVHDWRSPIASMFYDYELGNASYEAPQGVISGTILKKRQYTIEDAKLLHIFDNEINIDDELLQEVLADDTSDKMKNIVNTIQREQNQIIRNTRDKNLIVEGIAGSGKTSVALHRIAFLLYKIKELTSNDILIFSPNKVFSEYISNVLPELGESNTLQTTYHDYIKNYLQEFKDVQTFTDFIEDFYHGNVIDYRLKKYKQGDDIANDIDKFINNYVNNSSFVNDIVNRDFTITHEELNNLLHNKYKHFPLFKRIDVIAEKICDWYYNGKYNKKKSVIKMLYDNFNRKKDYLGIYSEFFNSEYSHIKCNVGLNKKFIHYEDAIIYIYIKFLLDEIDYNTSIQEIVIDEAQDYTRLQYMLLLKIFRNASYTILGDVNQTINPYYHYESLDILTSVFDKSRYLQLLKTYRSSPEIIEYTNKILNLDYVSAIRRQNYLPVVEQNDILYLERDLNDLISNYKSVAIITKTEEETNRIYIRLKDKFNITPIINGDDKFDRKLVVLPVYIAKGLEFDSVIVYSENNSFFNEEDKYLFYVACTRCQHQLIIMRGN